MRSKFNPQAQLDFRPSISSLTTEYCQKYESVSTILDENPEFVDLVHCELKQEPGETSRNPSRFTSDTVLRVLIAMIIEGLSLRDTVVRIDDSHYLRRFVRIYDAAMMDFTTLCKLRNKISSETWDNINARLGRYAVDNAMISGEAVRVDTTAVETDVHYPSDSSLLWDTYRTLAGLIDQARRVAPEAVGKGRLHTRRAKKLAQRIGRLARSERGRNQRIEAYETLIFMVSRILNWSCSVAAGLRETSEDDDIHDCTTLRSRIEHFASLGARVVDQAQRRVLNGEQVPNHEKLFSIFEEHTELLKRGKAKRDIEYGHMIQIQQVSEKFITDYTVFANKPVEYQLLPSIVESHESLFGAPPRTLAADKAYYQGNTVKCIEEKVNLVSIGKKGRGAPDHRETSPEFKDAQRFRAGVEGSIAFLKRFLMLGRVLNRGMAHFTATVGVTVLAHNLLVLSRL